MPEPPVQWRPLAVLTPGSPLAIDFDTAGGLLRAGTPLDRALLDHLQQAGVNELPVIPDPVDLPDPETLRAHLTELFSMAGEHAGVRQLHAALLDYRLHTPPRG